MPGLNNLGNTCYMNAVLQSIIHIDEIRDTIISNKNLNHVSNKNIKNSVCMELNTFFNQYCSSSNSLSPVKLRHQIIKNNNYFNNLMQHDSHELLVYLYDIFLTELSRSVNMHIKCNKNVLEYSSVHNKLKNLESDTELYDKYKSKLIYLKKKYIKDIYIIKSLHSWKSFYSKNYSELINVICGQLLSTISCDECMYLSIKFEPFTNLSLEIPTQSDILLTDCISNFIQKEKLSEGEEWKCSQCNKVTKSSKQINYWNLPKILTIHLKRFIVHNPRNIDKNQCNIEIPIDRLDLSEYISEYNYENTNTNIYECIAIICHSGSYFGGHYFAFCKRNDDWYLCNDSTYKKINLNLEIVNTLGYIMFYRQLE